MASPTNAFLPYQNNNNTFPTPVTFESDVTVLGTANFPVSNITSLNGWAPNFGLADSTGLISGGTGYAVGDISTFSNSATIAITAVSTGAVTQFTILNRGAATTAPQGTLNQISTTGTGVGLALAGIWAPFSSALYQGMLNPNNAGNLFIGYGIPYSVFSGTECTFVGYQAGGGFTGVSTFNTCMGHNAAGIGGGAGGITGSSNTIVGTDAARNSTGSSFNRNTFFGTSAGRNTTGFDNVLVGNGAGNNNLTSGSRNVVIGSSAASLNLATGSGNVVIGFNALLTGDVGNTVLIGGEGAGGNSYAGGTSVVIGRGAGNSGLTGGNNTLIGHQVAHTTLGNGQNNIMIGVNNNVDSTSASDTNNIVIGTQSGIKTTASSNSINIEGVIKATGTNTAATAVTTTSGPAILGGAGVVVASLPAAAAALKGARTFVTDASTATPAFMATLTGGGSAFVPVFCDGTVWRYG